MTGSTKRQFWTSLAGWSVLFFATVPAAPQSQTGALDHSFALRDGDTVVFYGDSITAQRLYTRFVEDFVLTRYPALNVRFVNAGVPGDTVSGGYAGSMTERLERGVVPFHPATITVMLGMNDGGWGYEPAKAEAAFEQGYRALISALRKAAPDAQIVLIRPTPYDEITHGTEFPGYSLALDKLADDVTQIETQLKDAGDKKIDLVDFHGPLVDALERAKVEFSQLAPLIVPDRIHPSETGHWIMAAALMSAWHADPVVSRVELNGSSAGVVEKERASVTNLEKTANGLKWTELDESLPLPLDFNNAMTPVLLRISDIASVDREMLQVDSLEPGQYQLLIDERPIAVFSRDELQKGVNLALLKTPMVEQARGIDSTEEQRAVLDHARFILSADVKENANSGVAEARLRQAEDELAETVRVDAKPKAHRFELRRQ
ncbi:MAG: SGNH/GDSL hydrolase family protein [Terracidiphilus sp.]